MYTVVIDTKVPKGYENKVPMHREVKDLSYTEAINCVLEFSNLGTMEFIPLCKAELKNNIVFKSKMGKFESYGYREWKFSVHYTEDFMLRDKWGM